MELEGEPVVDGRLVVVLVVEMVLSVVVEDGREVVVVLVVVDVLAVDAVDGNVCPG